MSVETDSKALRSDVAQKPPAPGIDLTSFPSSPPPEAIVFRAHDRRFEPWHFASHPGARFNLDDPLGTCYFASSVETAVRELYGPLISNTNSVSAATAERLRVSVVIPPAGGTYAHVSGYGAARFGVTSELTSMGDYTVPRAWAATFESAGFDGVRYDSRFMPGSESWALFGQAGPDQSLEFDRHSTLDGFSAIDTAGVDLHIDVDPRPPRKSAVRLVGPPPAGA